MDVFLTSMRPALGAAEPRCRIRLLWRGLFERSEFPSHLIRCRGGVYPKGRARAKMVLSTFAETKVLRRAGPKPRKEKNLCWSRSIHRHLKPHVLDHFLDFVGGVSWCREVAVNKEGIRDIEGQGLE